MGMELKKEYHYILQFAGDQTIITKDKKYMEYIMRKLMEEYQGWGLTVNTQKTKYLCIETEIENLILESNRKVARNMSM